MSITRTKVCRDLLGLMFVFSSGLAFYGVAHADEHGYRGHEFRESEFRQHQYLDSRYHHNRYYPPRGYAFAKLPPSHRVVYYHGAPYYFGGGIWYRHIGVNFVVVAPPFGLVVPILPPYYTTLWVGNVPYYYADNVYYAPSPQGGYVVTQAPPSNVVVEQQPYSAAAQQPGNVVEMGPANSSNNPPPPSVNPGSPQPGGVNPVPPQSPSVNPGQEPPGQLFVYPDKGQTQAQQTQDRNACHSWAVSQTGYNPAAQTGGEQTGDKLADYQRALSACLEGRGYTVR